MKYKILILLVLIASVLLSGCIDTTTSDKTKTWDAAPSDIISSQEFPVVGITKDNGDFWVNYNEEGNIKVAYVRPPHGNHYKINDEVVISNTSKIVVYEHGKYMFDTKYTTYKLYWSGN